MFVTYEEHKASFMNLFGDGLTHWKAAELALQQTWFLVTTGQSNSLDDADTFQASRTMLMFNTADLDALARLEDTKHLQLESVFIVTPGHVNGTSQWKMEQLLAVWRAEEPSAPGQFAEIFETANGVTYADSLLATPVKRLRKKKLHRTFPLPQ